MAEEAPVTPPTAEEGKSSVQEFLQREDEDESVRKWKESLLGDAAQDNAAASPPDDKRLVIPQEFKVVIEDGPTYTYNLQSEEGLAQLQKGYDLKEGCTFHYELTFLVHHDIVLGIKLHTKSKKAIKSTEAIFDIGSYPPTVAPIVKVMEDCECPAGAMIRGGYKAQCSVEDDMGRTHFKFEMKFNIVKA